MASTQAIAVMRATALNRLEAGFETLAALTGIEGPTLVFHKRESDPALAQVRLLEQFATWLEVYIAHEYPSPEAVDSVQQDWAAMSVGELKLYADAHSIDLGDATKKADIIAILED